MKREEQIFEQLLAQTSPEDRARALLAACAGDGELRRRVEALLAAHQDAAKLEFLQTTNRPPRPAATVPGSGTLAPTDPITERPGDQIGRYKLLEKLGEGGFGVVYMAEQREPVRRKVALKIIKAGMDTRQVVARFEAERQALALMDHPNIAKILDGGATGQPRPSDGREAGGEGSSESQISNLKSQIPPGRPYFVMELVRGIRLTDFCDQNHLGLNERLELFLQVCQAVQHAHQKGVIHRDLKPSNILVTINDGVPVPKVIDFGIAKATRQELTEKTIFTAYGQFLGTPAYMSPEQAVMTSLDIDTRSDIYSLGVLLYELLTGTTPFDAQELLKAGFDEMRRVIRETEPEKPSTRLTQTLVAADVRRLTSKSEERVPKSEEEIRASSRRLLQAKELIHQLRGDLDWIVMKCLEKDRARRYETANGLAADIQRHLSSEPVVARPPSAAYRFQKMARRNKVAFMATAVVFVALAVGIATTSWQAARARFAEREQFRLRQEAEAARATETDLRQQAETQALKARQFAYASDMNLAHQAIQEDDFYRALQLLDRHRPRERSADGPRPQQPGEKIDLGKSRAIRRIDALRTGTVRAPVQSAATDLRGWEWRYLWRQCQGEERFILGEHTNGATAVGLLADGKTVFSAGRDKLVRLWDLDSRRQIGLLPHAEEVIGAAASPDGRWLATVTEKNFESQPVLLWDLATQKLAATLTTNFWLRPGTIAFSPDNQWLVFATVFGGVRFWDVNARSEITNLAAVIPRTGASLGAAFSPDSLTLAYKENDYGAILLWDVASRSVTGRLTGHQSYVRVLAFSPDGQTLASGGQDRTTRLWNLTEQRERFRLTNQSASVTSLAFTPDGRTLAMSGGGGAGRVIRLFEVETGSQKAERRGHLATVSSLAFTPDGQTLLSASHDGTIRVWDSVPQVKEKSAHAFGQDSIVTDWLTYGPALCLSPDGRHLLTVYTNQTFSVWDTLRLAEGERHPLPFTNTTTAVVAPGGTRAAFASGDGEVRQWTVETGQTRFFAQLGTNQIHRMVYSPDGRSLAAANNTRISSQMSVANDTRRIVRVWDVGTQKSTHVFSTGGQFPVSLTFSADARTLIAGSYPGSIKLWPLDGLGEVATIEFSWQGGGLVLLSDGQTLISAGTDLRFWNVRTRHETDKLNPRAGAYHCLALSSDGLRLAAGGGDGRITIWDIPSHQEVATLKGHKNEVRHLAFTPDGNHLVSVSKDQLRVWHAASPTETDAATGKETRK